VRLEVMESRKEGVAHREEEVRQKKDDDDDVVGHGRN
jgi:hypothetical protein